MGGNQTFNNFPWKMSLPWKSKKDDPKTAFARKVKVLRYPRPLKLLGMPSAGTRQADLPPGNAAERQNGQMGTFRGSMIEGDSGRCQHHSSEYAELPAVTPGCPTCPQRLQRQQQTNANCGTAGAGPPDHVHGCVHRRLQEGGSPCMHTSALSSAENRQQEVYPPANAYENIGASTGPNAEQSLPAPGRYIIQGQKLDDCPCPTAGKTKHNLFCPRRRVECPDQRCVEKVRLQELLNHIKEKHPQTQYLGDSSVDNFSKQFWNIKTSENFAHFNITWVLALFQYDSNIFVTMFQKHHGQWMYWVYVLGSQDTAERYHYEIRLSSPDSSMTFDGKVHSIDEKKGSIRDAKDCLVLTDDVIRRYMSHDGITAERLKDGYDTRICIEYRITKMS